MWRMLLQQNFLELRQLCFHEVLIRWFSTWVAHWETTKVVSGVACRKLPGFSKHVFFKAQERSCPKTIKNRGKGHDNVCLLFLISADCVICKSHLVLVAVPTQVFFLQTQGPNRAKVLIWSSTDLPMAPRSKGHRFKGGEFMLAPYESRDWTWLDCRRSPAKPNCQSLESDPTVAGNGYDMQCCSHQFHVRELLLSPGAVGRQTSGASVFLVEETCGGSWCLWKFYRSKAIINHPYTMVNQKPELSREITVNWSHFVSGIIPQFVTR